MGFHYELRYAASEDTVFQTLSRLGLGCCSMLLLCALDIHATCF